MGRNILSICDECEVYIFHLRGKEGDLMQKFQNEHSDHEKSTRIVSDYVDEQPEHYKDVTDDLTSTPLPEKRNCMFQYATSYKYISTDIYEDTDLITLSEAKALWNKYKPQFISQLQDDTSNPEMVIWTDCESKTDYATELYYADNDTKTDGKNLWNEIVTRKELL